MCCYYRTCTYIYDHIHASGGGGFSREHYRSSSIFYGDKRGVHQGSVPLEHSTKALNTTSKLWEILARTPHVQHIHTEIDAANQIIIVQHPKATDIGWSTLPSKCNNIKDALYSNEHYSKHGTQHSLTTNNAFARKSSLQRAPTASF